MLRSLLFLSWCLSGYALANDRADSYLPRAGQTVDVFNGDLTNRVGRSRLNVQRDDKVYTLQGSSIPTMHFLYDEQRFSIPGVTSTDPAQKFDEQGVLRYVYRGAQSIGSMEKHAQMELVKFDDGRCQLSWKLSVINRGSRLRNDEGSMAYDCLDLPKIKEHRRGTVHLLPNNLLDR